MTTIKEKIFISYARADKAIVLDIYQTLTNANMHPWLDIIDILPGEDWRYSIKNAIQESIVFLAIVSKNSCSRRGMIQKEILLALEQWDSLLPEDIYLIPVKIDDSPLPERLAKFQAVDWLAPIGKDRLISAIKRAVAQRV